MMLNASFLNSCQQSVGKNSNFLKKLYKNRSQISENYSKIDPRVVVKSQRRSKRGPNANFLRFLATFWRPRPSQIRAKIGKTPKKAFQNLHAKKRLGFQHLVLSIFPFFGVRKRSQDSVVVGTFSITPIL